MSKRSLFEIQQEIIAQVKPIKILENISWPAETEKAFFSEFQKGNRPILKVDYPKSDFHSEEEILTKLKKELSIEHPVHVYISETIDSYINAIRMIHAVGTKEFETLSLSEYGSPHHKLFGSKYSHLETAKSILQVYHQFDHPTLADNSKTYSATELKKYLVRKSKTILGEQSPKIILSKKLTAKAAAGKSRVRIRSNAEFSKYDFDQLLIHEIMTHSLTAINGSLQREMPLLAQGAPRTSKTQEGLATFSEVITGSMDLVRLKRISLRLMAIDMALKGADFYDLFDFFRSHEQDDRESYLSASRILRGGTPAGGICFTKDGIYLEGLIRVHSFFRWAFKSRNLDLTHYLFAGRFDINDIFLLKNDFASGFLTPPVYLPEWYQNIDQLAGKMAFSLVLNGIDLESVERHYASKLLKMAA